MHKIISFQTISSTNAYLKDNYRDLAEGDVCFSLHQSEGRGRLGRVWKDDGKDLLFSILFKVDLDENFASALPLIAGAAMEETLKELGIKTAIKWPNDILLGDRKCCGILVEAITEEKMRAIVLGVGLNLNEESFPEEIAYKATSLFLKDGKIRNPQEVLPLYLRHFDALLSNYRKGGKAYLEVVANHFYLFQKKVSLDYHGEGIVGEVLGIDDKGNLVVFDGEKEHHVSSGEATLERNYKSL
ncbi:MAG: biotin--[acetyl-CoA-carboxylase] ligase [Bacilli bacterium]|nr:biotin--[acetyl-CoA-carboxylase] ligase [Bacilli bacterium]